MNDQNRHEKSMDAELKVITDRIKDQSLTGSGRRRSRRRSAASGGRRSG